MPRKIINDYVFYKFVCNDENIKCCYVGSTANFSDRRRRHLQNYNKPYQSENNLKIYETIRANGGWENWKMVIIGEAKEISLTQSRILEQNYIDELEAKMNMVRAYTSTEQKKEQQKIYSKEYNKIKYENNKEQISEQRKIKYENNKEEINERCKAYREANKEIIKEKGKAYREANKEKLIEQRKIKYENNKEKIKEQKRLYRLKKKEEKNNV